MVNAFSMLAIEAEIEPMTELVQRHMSEVPARYFNLKVPLVADVGTGANWQDAKGRE